MVKSNAEFCTLHLHTLHFIYRSIWFIDGGHVQLNPSEELLSWSASGNWLLPQLKDELLTAIRQLRGINASLTAFRACSLDCTNPNKKRAVTPWK